MLSESLYRIQAEDPKREERSEEANINAIRYKTTNVLFIA